MASKKKPARARPRKTGRPTGVTKRDLIVTLEGLEIAKGYDGPLRGKPEPSLLVAAFGRHTPPDGVPVSTLEPARLLGRTLTRFTPNAPPPCRCVARGSATMRARILTPMRVLVLVVAIEEDSGDDVATNYARFEDLRALSIWNGRSEVPDPCAIADLFESAAWTSALDESAGEGGEMSPVRVLAAGQDIGDECAGDDYVGSVAMRLELDASADRSVRARAVSADGANDWTALLRVVAR